MKEQTTTNYAIYFADMEGIFKQVRWALSIQQQKLTEISRAQRTLAAYHHEPERRDRLPLVRDRLARSTKAAIWLEAHELIMDEMVESCLGESV